MEKLGKAAQAYADQQAGCPKTAGPAQIGADSTIAGRESKIIPGAKQDE